jgi:hypothetical protein
MTYDYYALDPPGREAKRRNLRGRRYLLVTDMAANKCLYKGVGKFAG